MHDSTVQISSTIARSSERSILPVPRDEIHRYIHVVHDPFPLALRWMACAAKKLCNETESYSSDSGCSSREVI